MNYRAICGGARTSRNCPSWGLSCPDLRKNSVNFDFATTAPGTGLGARAGERAWRGDRGLCTMPAALGPAHCSPGTRVRERARARERTYLRAVTASAGVAHWGVSRPKRDLSFTTTRYSQKQDEPKSKDQYVVRVTPSLFQPNCTRVRPAIQRSQILFSTRPTSPEPSAAPGPAEPRGIRKVIPKMTKVIPSLTPHENIYTVPNLLTFSRLVTAPFIGYAILHDAHAWALGLFAYAGVSDLLDGWIARRWKLQTVVGSVVDPMADKTLMTILTVCLAAKGALPVWLAAIILGRDVGLGIAAIYYRWISLPPPKTFTRYWDFSLPSAEVRPTTISKYNTFLQLGLMGSTMVVPLLSADVGGLMSAFQYLVATTTVWSGLSYVFSKDAVKILSHGKEKSRG
ncbi:hypothetical protein AAE478_003914 [Parahypoxylon ruwenzoriense]